MARIGVLPLIGKILEFPSVILCVTLYGILFSRGQPTRLSASGRVFTELECPRRGCHRASAGSPSIVGCWDTVGDVGVVADGPLAAGCGLSLRRWHWHVLLHAAHAPSLSCAASTQHHRV